MGVPAFFRWLCTRNPSALWEVMENPEDFNACSENPEIDNLYLDMNGIIHPCSHPENSGIPTPVTINDMFVNVFNYVDRVMDLVRPKKLIYMAIDGVAPRAKMNQQRARRFRAAQEAETAYQQKKQLLAEWITQGKAHPTINEYIDSSFDSNQITPGTEFMMHLTIALQYYIYDRMNNHPLFKDLIIIFSDASIPGEGEHKILSFIREQRAEVGYNPNTRHCLYGADADLIMLGLSTHEPWFYIIRETIMQGDDKMCSICQQRGHFFTECKRGQVNEDEFPEFKIQKDRTITVNFQMLQLFIVREWLWLEVSDILQIQNGNGIKETPDLERLVDDFIFMCFLVGNDFIPHMPSLRITEGGVDCLLILYKLHLRNGNPYITDCGNVNLKALSSFFRLIGNVEEGLMRGQQKKLDMKQKRQQQDAANTQSLFPSEEQQTIVNSKVGTQQLSSANALQEFKKELKEKLAQVTQAEMNSAQLLKQEDQLSSWRFLTIRQRYYTEKFHIGNRQFLEFRDKLRQSFVESLCWTMKYYYSGCPDWGWFYQFHYAPFAQDVTGCEFIKIEFDSNSKPFKPFQQLLAVLPGRSRQFLPEEFHYLLTSPESPIADFYPIDFTVDLKGKRFAWLGEVLLPFVDADRLIQAHDKVQIRKEETALRNGRGQILVFYNKELPVGFITKDFGRKTNNTIPSPLPGYQDLKDNQIKCQLVLGYSQIKKPNYIVSKPLIGCVQPPLQLDAVYQQNSEDTKRSFGGEAVKRIIASVLGLPLPYNDNYRRYNNYEKRRGVDLNELDRQRKIIKN